MKNPMLIYDLVSLPNMVTDIPTHEIITLMMKEKRIMWDSSKGGVEPKVLDMGEDYKIIDVKENDTHTSN